MCSNINGDVSPGIRIRLVSMTRSNRNRYRSSVTRSRHATLLQCFPASPAIMHPSFNLPVNSRQNDVYDAAVEFGRLNSFHQPYVGTPLNNGILSFTDKISQSHTTCYTHHNQRHRGRMTNVGSAHTHAELAHQSIR
jgi:hypothetical protein